MSETMRCVEELGPIDYTGLEGEMDADRAAIHLGMISPFIIGLDLPSVQHAFGHGSPYAALIAHHLLNTMPDHKDPDAVNAQRSGAEAVEPSELVA